MTKTQLLDRISGDPDQRLLLAKLLDKHQLCQERNVPACSAFLSPGEQALVQQLFAHLPQGTQRFFGGYAGAERRICAFLPPWMEAEDFEAQSPLCALTVAVPPMALLSHRDYLGALMGLGITREKLGDILPAEAGCQLVLLEDVLPILLDQWEKVGRYPIRLSPLPLKALQLAPAETKLIRHTVASLRLDAVVGAGFSLSRGEAARMIQAGRVSLNHLPCDKTDRLVAEGDTISCRGLGKCVLTQVGGKSRKGRTVIELERFV